MKEKIITFLKRFKIAENLMGDYGYRTIFFGIISFIVSFGFAIFNGVLGIILHSIWYGAMSGYYIILGLIRMGLMLLSNKAKKQNNEEQKIRYKKLIIFRNCGIAIFILAIAMSIAVTKRLTNGNAEKYAEIMAITYAVYTFYKITLSIINIFKAKNYQDPIVQSLRNINLADALMSLFALQITLVTAFSEDGFGNATLNNITGIVVCIAVFMIGVGMVVIGQKRLNENKIKEKNKNE